jgi:hypothetical protein
MALLPSESPAVIVREVDLSGIVPAVTSSTGAMVGDFNWGPANQPVLVGNEAELVANFGSPTLVADSNNVDFLSAAQFLKYTGSLYVTRGVSTTKHRNAIDSDAASFTLEGATTGGVQLVENEADWNASQSGLANTHRFIAKYPGEAGNSLKISICPASASDTAFDGWTYASNFDGAPGTSTYVSERADSAALAYDEAHVIIIDEDGNFTGTPGNVLETFPYVSLATDAKTENGSTNFILDVLNRRSSYVWAASAGSKYPTTNTASNFKGWEVTRTVTTTAFNGGTQPSGALTKQEYIIGFDQYEDEDQIQVDFLIAPGLGSAADQKDIIDDLETTARSFRKDCVVVASPARDDVVNINNTTDIVDNLTTFAATLPSSSYLIVDNNYLKVYDKYNDKYVFIPAASSTAGIMGATDFVAAPWFSPAGNRRGQYFGTSSLAWSPTKSQRDKLYKVGINPIANIPGQGVLLYGDKTRLTRPSAFDRINVRRLFLVMERAIKAAAQQVMFEFNDEFTRSEFVNIVEPFLREIQGRRGITDFRVVCDETNNTSQIIDTNQFVADIYVKPARSINYVTLSFVAVRTGVDFDEVVGLA